jgi:4a-hydroxytetrahydrobiopterin dehydratase
LFLRPSSNPLSKVILSKEVFEFEIFLSPYGGNMEMPVSAKEAKELLEFIPGWELAPGGKMIYREYVMKDFLAAVDFIARLAKAAEEENHHPDIHLTAYRRLRLELSTHEAGGLSRKDFSLANIINTLTADLK